MKIIGIGVDVVETARIASSINEFGEAFLNRVFTEGEVAYCGRMKLGAPHYAARFAAKEAVSKAFGVGIGEQIGWRDIEVTRNSEGAPVCLLHGNARALAERLGVSQVLISLSHAEHYSVANAVVVASDAS